MAEFEYEAKDKSGKTVKGVIEAQDKRSAIGLLRNQVAFLISIEEHKKRAGLFSGLGGAGKGGLFAKKIKFDDITVFTRQLSTMLDAGIPIVSALDILAEQMEKPRFKDVISQLRNDVETGYSLSDALAKHKNIFSPLFVNMTRAGEASGTLDEILDRLATYVEKTSNLQKKIKSAMIYPAVVVTMAFGITLFLLIRVIPVFKEIYSGFGAALPVPTQVLISLSDFLRAYFLFFAIGAAAVAFLVHRYVNTDKGRLKFDRFKLRVPVFGPLIRKVAISNFSRTLSTLTKSGVPILNSLEIVARTSGNRAVEVAVNKVRDNVKEGERIAEPLEKSGVFPPMVVRMVSVGEKSGELEKMLSKIADFYDVQVETSVSALTSLIEPFVIAFLGIVIGTIVISMFLPVFQMSEILGV